MRSLIIVMGVALLAGWAQRASAQQPDEPRRHAVNWGGDWLIRLATLDHMPREIGVGAALSDVIRVSPRGMIQLAAAAPDAFAGQPQALARVQRDAIDEGQALALIAPFWAELAAARCEALADPGAVSYTESAGDDGPALTIRWENMPQADCQDEGRATFELELIPLEAGLQLRFKYEALPVLRPHPDRPGPAAAPRAGVVLGDPMELFPDGGAVPVTDRGHLLLSLGSEGLRDEQIAPGVWVIEVGPDGAVVGDDDFDGLREADNCPNVANPLQVNTDRAAELIEQEQRGLDPEDVRFGDACDHDDDADSWLDVDDNCPLVHNFAQADTDGDGLGDACDDSDGDGWLDAEDNCWWAPNPDQGDLDFDGVGEPCDQDADGDSVKDELDNCPRLYNPGQFDQDRDRVGDSCDLDPDGDGVPTIGDEHRPGDVCPRRADPGQGDWDGDGLGDACDLAPNQPCFGACEMLQADDDGDRVPNGFDMCPAVFDPWQDDRDGDGKGDACDADADGDGVVDVVQGRCFMSQWGPLGACDEMISTEATSDYMRSTWTEAR